jgi:mono/diheme cytochrome c family protein
MAGVIALAASIPAVAAEGKYPGDPASLANGRELAEIHCAVCHAVAEDDESREAGAPAFRDLSVRYPLDNLEESLAEGIVTAHENMPEFAFEPDDIDAFLGYLTSIQAK